MNVENAVVVVVYIFDHADQALPEDGLHGDADSLVESSSVIVDICDTHVLGLNCCELDSAVTEVDKHPRFT